MEHFFCIIILLFLGIFSYIYSNRDVLSVPVVFCFSYFIAAIVSWFYRERWLFYMSMDTLIVLSTGSFCFVIGYFFCTKNIAYKCSHVRKKVIINKWKTILFILLESILLYGSLEYINGISNAVELSDKIAEYYVYRASGLDVFLGERPFYLTYLTAFCNAGVFVYMYKLANNYMYTNKLLYLDVLVIFLSIIINLLSGSRGGVIMLFFAIVIYFYITWKKKNGWNRQISTQLVMKFIFILVTMLILFVSVTSLQGRDDTKELEDNENVNVISFFFDYLSVYCGAELKLLDMYIDANEYSFSDSTYIGMHTLSEMGKNIYNLTGDSDWTARDYRPQVAVNGVFIGNVYGMYRNYIADGGLAGVCFFSLLFGLIMGAIYRKIHESTIDFKGIEPYLLIYGYLYYTVPLSFFSNWFFAQISQYSVHVMLDWILIYFFFLEKGIFEKDD